MLQLLMAELQLDAVDLKVSGVTSTVKIAKYTVGDKAIKIIFDSPIKQTVESMVVITYEAEPNKGFYFRTHFSRC